MMKSEDLRKDPAALPSGATGSGPRLYPVILAVPPLTDPPHPRRQTERLSRLARRALQVSARLGGLAPGRLEKDARGAPLPSDGCYWTLTHKPRYVGALAAAHPVGMDIERIRSISPALANRVAGEEEWRLDRGGDRLERFFRFWTAKEAAVKASGAGFRDFRKCRIRRVSGRNRLDLEYRGRLRRVAFFYFDEHLAAVADAFGPLQWTRMESPPDVPAGENP